MVKIKIKEISDRATKFSIPGVQGEGAMATSQEKNVGGDDGKGISTCSSVPSNPGWICSSVPRIRALTEYGQYGVVE